TTIRRTLRGWMCGVDPDHVLIVGGPGACGWVPRNVSVCICHNHTYNARLDVRRGPWSRADCRGSWVRWLGGKADS
ncbi:hypothetical protein TGCOUG_396580, partial [Toxoplasma gondii COUG]